MLKVDNISISYRGVPLLKELSFSVLPGEIVTLIGASGSGKSSLLRACAGLLPVEGGIISMECPEVTYLMQDDLLLPWRTVIDNVRFFAELGPRHRRPNIPVERASEMLKEVGLGKVEGFYPAQLSGGMRQRVALARALLQDRPLILMDEPFSALDVILRESLYELLRRIHRRFNRTMLMVTHDFRDGLVLSDRVLLLGEGRIAEEWAVTDEIRNSPERMGALCGSLREALRDYSLVPQ